MNSECIFCGSSGPFLTREHILPESLGGDDSFIMNRQCVCDGCQSYFGSKIERLALNNYPFSHWRTFGGILTKKRKIPFFDDVEGTIFGRDEFDDLSIAFHPVFHRAILEGRKTQMRLLATPTDPIYVCRFLLKMGLEILHEDGVDNALNSRYVAAKQFARFCRPGSRWWFGIADSERNDQSVGLGITDIKNGDYVFSISNGHTALFTPIVLGIIPGNDTDSYGERIRFYRCTN